MKFLFKVVLYQFSCFCDKILDLHSIKKLKWFPAPHINLLKQFYFTPGFRNRCVFFLVFFLFFFLDLCDPNNQTQIHNKTTRLRQPAKPNCIAMHNGNISDLWWCRVLSVSTSWKLQNNLSHLYSMMYNGSSIKLGNLNYVFQMNLINHNSYSSMKATTISQSSIWMDESYE